MPRKIVINKCYGGFSLSQDVKALYQKITSKVARDGSWDEDADVNRDDPVLIQVIESVGVENAGGTYASLCIVEIPDDVPEDGWIIQEYDGVEWVAEKHRTWPEMRHN
jgi:hypothetical protein